METIVRKLSEYLARKASSLAQRYTIEDIVGSSLAPLVERSIEKLVNVIIKDRNGALWCRLCDRGPFTKRGFYLHLIRVHMKDLEYMIEQELKRLLEVVHR